MLRGQKGMVGIRGLLGDGRKHLGASGDVGLLSALGLAGSVGPQGPDGV